MTKYNPARKEAIAQYSIGIKKQVCGELSTLSPVL